MSGGRSRGTLLGFFAGDIAQLIDDPGLGKDGVGLAQIPLGLIQLIPRHRDLRLAGVALSPEYVYSIRPGELIPDDRHFGILWMRRRALAVSGRRRSRTLPA